MSGSKKKRYEKKSFESDGSSGDTSANIYMSMLQSEAWRDLTAQQQRLYLYCKAQYYGQKKKPNDDSLCFNMNQAKWSGYGLYKVTNASGFYRDMAALTAHGFIACVESGAATRTKSVYRFSDAWKHYGSDAFTVSPASLTTTQRRRK